MSTEICVARTRCRICGHPDLRPVIDLGSQCLASVFVNGEAPPHLQKKYPLTVLRCAGECGLVQLGHTVDPSELYCHGSYGYRSGTNELMRANLREIVARIEETVALRPGDTVLDIGCNDGTLLDSYQTPGLDRIGFDPALNIVQSAREKGLEVVSVFFSLSAFREARPRRQARAVTSIAMFYDLEDPCRFVGDVAKLLADDGVWVIELSYLPFMLENTAFDTICHEHLEYYALRQIEWMISREDLQVHKLEFNEINGGSFRLFIRKKAAGPPPADELASIEKTRRDEVRLGLETDRPYETFCAASEGLRRQLRALLVDLRARGKVVHVYGASTKGNTILQFCGIDHALIAKAADRNPEKWGRRTLGTDIPIVSEEESRAERPDYYLVLPWHFLGGFFKREEAFLDRGGKFIIPIPRLRVAGRE
jgi:NDP-4-keto-2,6-dideoxyhexose 3-C-methyltransferase